MNQGMRDALALSRVHAVRFGRRLFPCCAVALLACGGSSLSPQAEEGVVTMLTILVDSKAYASVNLAVGGRVQFTAMAKDAKGIAVPATPPATWHSSGASAAVDAQGVVTGVSAGTVYVRALITSTDRQVVDSVRVLVIQPLGAPAAPTP